jgi:hypothetical protein
LQDRVEIAIDCCDSLGVLHRYGLSYGDISGNNVVARLDNPRGVFFFDVDSISPVDLRARAPLKSPGWETPDGLGPIEIDRSRTALLIVRLLSEDLNALPGHDLSGLLGGVRGRELSDLLRVCHETGSEQHFLGLRECLRNLPSSGISARQGTASSQVPGAGRVRHAVLSDASTSSGIPRPSSAGSKQPIIRPLIKLNPRQD